MSATIDGARVAALLGRCAGDRERRAAPFRSRRAISAAIRARRSRSRWPTRSCARCAPSPARCWRSCRAPREIRRTETLLRERVDDPSIDVVALLRRARCATCRTAPSRRRRRAAARSCSPRRSPRPRSPSRACASSIDCGLARVPRYEPDVGLTRLETVRVSRAAADQRRGRAGRTEPGVCYRLWDEPQTASLEPLRAPEILAADLSEPCARSRRMGRGRSGDARLPRSAAARGAGGGARAAVELGAIDGDGRITDEGRRAARACRCRRGSRAWWSTRRARGAGALAADIAAVLTERGLGGNDVDLTHRLDASAPRPLAPRRGRPRDGEALGAMKPRARSRQARQGRARRDRMRFRAPASLLALAYPDRIAKNRGGGGASCSPTGAARNVDPASPLAREPFLAVGRDHRQRRAGPHRAGRADHACRDRGAFRRPHRERATRSRSTREPRACARAALRRLGAIALGEQPRKVEPTTRPRACSREGIARLGIDRLPWTKALTQWRDRVMFLRRAEGDEWPDLSDAALAANAADWLAPCFAGKTALVAARRRRS